MHPSDPGSGAVRPQRGAQCEAARQLTARFVAGGLTAAGRKVLNAHLAGCSPCKVDYRTSLEAAGRLGASVRKDRVARIGWQREGRTERLRRIAIEASSGTKHRHRGAFLKLVLVPAGVVFLLSQLAAIRRPSRPLAIEWTAGIVRLGEAELDAAHPSGSMRRGDWCYTEPGGGARIAAEKSSVQVGESTQVLLEDAGEPRYLLRRGRLELDGEARVTTPLGLVTVESGAGAVQYGERKLCVESAGGSLSVVNASGRRRVTPSDRTLVLE